MDQISIINQLKDCLDQQKVIKLQLEWFDGHQENILLEPFLIGRNIDSRWTFIYGRVPETDQVVYIPVICIVSIEGSDQSFSMQDKYKYFLLVTNENVRVKKSIPDIIISDLSNSRVIKEKDTDDLDFEKDDLDCEYEEDEDSEYYKHPCTYCDSADGCEHLVILYDRSDNECISGCYEELKKIRSMIETTFLTWLKDKKEIEYKNKEINEYLLELWWYSADHYNKRNQYVDFDYGSFSELIRDILEVEIGADFFEYAACGGGPSEDTMWVCYSEDPKALMLEVENIIKNYLKKMAQTEILAD